MGGMRSNSEKWEANDVARLISTSWCGWRLRKRQRALCRGSATLPKSAAPRAPELGVFAVATALWAVQSGSAELNRPQAGGYNYKPINSRTYFTGGLP